MLPLKALLGIALVLMTCISIRDLWRLMTELKDRRVIVPVKPSNTVIVPLCAFLTLWYTANGKTKHYPKFWLHPRFCCYRQRAKFFPTYDIQVNNDTCIKMQVATAAGETSITS